MLKVSGEMQVLLAVVAAATDTDADCVVRRALDRKLGAGWAWEFSSARSSEERVGVLERRILLSSPSAFERSDMRRETLKDATSHEDGGAR